MKKPVIALALVLAVALPVAGCSSTTDTAGTDSDATSEEEATTEEDAEDDAFDAAAFYEGKWRGGVELTGSTVYGDVTGTEQMLDVDVSADGTCTVTPLDGHEDLLTDSGTWEGTETTLTLHLTSGDIEMTVVSDYALVGDSADFGIDGFDEINFVLY